MDLGIRGKTAVITAASRGLGRAVAESLAAEGANLLLCSRSEESVAAVAAALSDTYGIRAAAMAADVGNASDIELLQERAESLYGGVDALLCNAGGPPPGGLLTLTDEQWEQAFQTNMMSVVRLIRSFYPLLKQSGGRVVTIASSSVKVPIPGLMLSNTFRAGLAGFMKTLSIELGPDRILLNTVCPGRIRTDRLDELDQARALREGRSVESLRQEIVRDIPLGRYGEPQELAGFAAYLLSPANSYMTGSVFYVDGGMVKAL